MSTQPFSHSVSGPKRPRWIEKCTEPKTDAKEKWFPNSDADFLPRALATPRRTQEQINKNGKIPVRAHRNPQEPPTATGLCFFLRDPSSFTRALALSSRFFSSFRRRFWALRIFLCVKLWVRAGNFWALAFFAFFPFRSCFGAFSSAAVTARPESEPDRRSGESWTLPLLSCPPGFGIEGSGRPFGMSRGLLSREEAP